MAVEQDIQGVVFKYERKNDSEFPFRLENALIKSETQGNQLVFSEEGAWEIVEFLLKALCHHSIVKSRDADN